MKKSNQLPKLSVQKSSIVSLSNVPLLSKNFTLSLDTNGCGGGTDASFRPNCGQTIV
jgi:hypothetical protein